MINPEGDAMLNEAATIIAAPIQPTASIASVAFMTRSPEWFPILS